MDLPNPQALLIDVLDDLLQVAGTRPNERLPKEEQARCAAYAHCRARGWTVCVERGYATVGSGNHSECDLALWANGEVRLWIEIKRCWSGREFIRKPKEQCALWYSDIAKLRSVDVRCVRWFMLVGVFDRDPLAKDVRSDAVIGAIRSIFPSRLIASQSTPTTWLADDGMSHIAAWIWEWPSDAEIEPIGQPAR